MKNVLIVASAALALSACATGPGFGGRGYIGGDLAYNAYYDDAYGPYYDGYWGRDGGFWYSSGRGAPYQRDSGEHFRRSMAPDTAGSHAEAASSLSAAGPGGSGHAFHGVHSRGGIHRH